MSKLKDAFKEAYDQTLEEMVQETEERLIRRTFLNGFFAGCILTTIIFLLADWLLA